MKFKIPSSANFIQKIKHGNYMNPTRDWIVIISIVFVVLVVGIVWNVFAFLGAVSGPTISNTVPTKSAVLDSNAMHKVNKLFDARRTEQLKYESGAYTFSDPS